MGEIHLFSEKYKVFNFRTSWIDNDLEVATRNCTDCARYKADPTKTTVHFWEYSSMPWERIHEDFGGSIFEHIFLVTIDVCSF